MKKIILLLALVSFGMSCPIQAQRQGPNRSPHIHSVVINKDPGEGGPVNFGIAFAPTFDWMYTSTEGYKRDGFVVGMRYGFPVNINLTKGKNFYVSTGVFVEHLGGKLSLRDSVVLPGIGGSTADIHRTYRNMYLMVPVGITLKTNPIDNFYICGNAGFYNALLLGANHIDACELGENDELWSREKQPYTEAFVLKESVFAGIGFEYAVTPKMRAGVMVNYVHSLTNYFKGRNQAYNSVLNVDPKATFGRVEIVLHINFL